MPRFGYVPLLALLPRRVTDDEIRVIVSKLVAPRRRQLDNADVGVEITRVTHEMPLPDDINRVQRRLASIGWSGNHLYKPPREM